MRKVCTAFALSLLLAAGASATTFTVTNTNDSGPGSLRQAITDANATFPTASTVAFSIGSGVQTIMPLSVFPMVRENVTVDGSTQPGYAGTPLIELNDSLIAGSSFLSCLESSGTIRALALNRCSQRALGMFGGRVTACFIGTDVTGHTALPNSVGLYVFHVNAPTQVGGSTDAEGNLISGNGVNVIIGGQGCDVSHNKVGTDVTGEAALGFNGSEAISVQYTSDVTIHDNVVAAHSMGIECFYSDRTLINGNYVGVSKSGHPLPNSLGIHVYQSNFTQIGIAGMNVIAYNTAAGIEMDGASIRNVIRGNSIHHNGGLGIDLSTNYTVDGVTPNDAGDADTGPNLLQNYPVLTKVTSVGGVTTITGTINSTPNQLITLDFYASSACSSSGYGEADYYLVGNSVQTDANGNGSFAVSFPTQLATSEVVTATATDPYGDTSEFSACIAVQGAGTFAFSAAAVSADEGSGSATLTIRRTNSTGGAASVSYATANGTATAGSDYTGTAGTLEFADGETSKTFSVPIFNDAFFEGNESFTVALSGPTNGVGLGNPQLATVTIIENDAAPSLSIADARMNEGNSGTTNMPFIVTLTGATTVAATVQYQTGSNSATAGSDFQSVSGTLTFNPGETQKTINVPIFGDTSGESDETFSLSLFSPVNATIARSSAFGTIVNDDAGPAVTASDVTIFEGNNGTRDAVITLTANQPFYGQIDYFTVDGTAKSSSDYTFRSSSVFFNNETSKTITIPIVSDTLVEGDETFTVRLSLYNYSSPSFTLTQPVVTVTIVNDDTGIGPNRLSIPTGDTLPLLVNIGSTTPQPVTFTSSNPSVATVPATVQVTGAKLVDVTGVHPGDATITATLPPAYGGITATIEVYVYDPVKLVLTPSAVHVPVGGTATIRASFDPALNVAETAGLRTLGLGQIASPDTLTVDPGQTTTFTIKGVKSGHVILNATLGSARGNAVTSVDIEVEEAPTTPIINQVSPANGPASGGTAVMISGANLRSDCTIRFGSNPSPSSSFVSATSMTATTPAHAPGAVDVSLACGADAFNFTSGFTYLLASATLSNVTPSFGGTGGNTLVRITGTNIASSCWAFFDGLAARTAIVNGPAEMIASTPAHADAATVAVTLRCSGAATVGLSDAFTYSTAAEPSPVITAVDPLVGSPGKSVTISGARFRLDDAVTFDAAAATVLSTSVGTHVVRIPEVPLGKTSITVTDVLGHASTTGPIFTIVEPQPPQITAVTPPTTRPANVVILDGNGFRPGYAFTIGDQPAATLTMTYTRVVLRVPQLAAGSYEIDVINSASKIAAVGPRLKIVADGPAITRVAPNCATTDAGGRMTITGTGFVTGAVVSFDGVVAAGAVVVDAQTITLPLPPLPAGTPRVVVTNPNSDWASMMNAFSVTSPLNPNGCTPRSRPARH